jgi:hypothetical protein
MIQNIEHEKLTQDLTNLKYILSVIHSYPKALKELELTDLIDPLKVISSYLDWQKMHVQFDTIEKGFFSKDWLPISKTSMEYFVDLSDSKYPMLKVSFNSMDPTSYELIILHKSIVELIHVCESIEEDI